VKKAFLVLITIALVVGLSLSGIIPVAAQEPPDEGKVYTEVTLPLSTETVADVHTIPRGSVVYHFDDGTTEIYGPNNEFILAARDSEAAVVPVPTRHGVDWATHVYDVSNSNATRVEAEGDTTYVYDGAICILTIVDENPAGRTLPANPSTATATTTTNTSSSPPPPPSYTGYIEYSFDWVNAIDYFYASWKVPPSPTGAATNTVDYLFNGIVDQSNTIIIQPVLEYNYARSATNKVWTGAAWVVWAGGELRKGAVSASVGNTIQGTMSWQTTTPGNWDVKIKNATTGKTAPLLTTSRLSTDLNVGICCALEGLVITGNEDVPGDTTFRYMVFKHNGSTISITWTPFIVAVPGLSGLQVICTQPTPVTLNTDGG